MLKRLVRDESGVALGLAIIMVVLIGVMGAGLLVFVNTDLQNVIQVNSGQKAFDTAEAGLKAAHRHLLSDASKGSYDGNSPNNPSDSTADSPWSSAQGGKSVTFDGNTANVQIQYLAPTTNSAQITDTTAPDFGKYAPEILPAGKTDYKNGKNYFKVVSTGCYPAPNPATPNVCPGAKRRVEAIYNTYDLNVPQAYYTPGNVTISGSACIQNVSVFSGGNVTFNGNGKCKNAAGANIGHFKGNDLAYGNWNKPPLNTTSRPVATSGAGALGTITGSTKLGTRDFSTTTNPKFIQKSSSDASQTSSEITFPFNVAKQPDGGSLCDAAKEQEKTGEQHYYADSSSGNATLSDWPANSTKDTVVCYDFTSGSNHTLTWAVGGNNPLPSPYNTSDYSGCNAPVRKGTLVVRGGNFTIKPNTALFSGVVVVRGTSLATDVGANLTGNVCLDGFINSSGPITISGSVTPTVTAATVDRPGFYGVNLWSWRELYQ